MIKTILSLVFATCLIGQSIAQSIEIVNPKNDVYADYLADAEAKFTVKNISNKTVNIKVKREILEVHSTHINYFCWTVCYTPETDVSPSAEEIPPGGENHKFTGYIGFEGDAKNGNIGSSLVRYCFFNAEDESDQVCITVRYHIEEPASLIVPQVKDYELNSSINYWNIYNKGDEYMVDFDVSNYQDVPVDIKVKRQEISKVSSHTSYFCWGNCYAPEVDESPSHQTLQGGASQLFSAHLMIDPSIDPTMNMGQTAYQFVFYDVNDPNDSVMVPLTFDVSVPTSLEDAHATSGVKLGLAYPNPASGQVAFDYQNTNGHDAVLELVNQLGQTQLEAPISRTNGRLVIPTDKYPAGIYFYRLKVDGVIGSARRLIIQ